MRGTRAQGLAIAAVLAGVILLLVPAFAGATIVYRHDGDIWAMNDDGSGAHALVTTTQIPGPGPWTIGGPDVLAGGNTIVFTGTTNAYNDGPSAGPPGGCGINCSGTYKLQNGALTRLSAAPAPCGASQQWCTSFETDPRLTADGLVAFNSFLTTWDYSCAQLPCEWQFIPGGSSDTLQTRSVTDGSGRTQWTNANTLATESLPSPDPVDPTKIAYADETFGSNSPCGSQNEYIEETHRDGSGATTIVCDDAPFVSLAWVPDGSALIDVEAGTQAGIWAYDDSSATNPSKNYLWLLADPRPYDSSNPYSTSITTARYMGPDKIVFDQNGDLYTIPLTACAQKASQSAAGCTMADAHRLTNDGKSTEAVWTTQPILALGQKLNPNPPPPNPNPKPSAACKVPKLGGLTVGSARTALSRAHCALGKQHTAYSSKVKKGRIISQSIRSGRTLKSGSKVDVTVSKGKKPRRRRHH